MDIAAHSEKLNRQTKRIYIRLHGKTFEPFESFAGCRGSPGHNTKIRLR